MAHTTSERAFRVGIAGPVGSGKTALVDQLSKRLWPEYNLAASFSPELVDVSIYVIDVAGGDKIPRKGGPGITRSDLLVINKIDLAPHVGASLEVMDCDSRRMRGG